MLLKQSSEELPTINLTPMLDVVFNLIVFFMVGTKFTEWDHQLKVNVPQVSEAGPLVASPRRKEVAITRDGVITLEGKPLGVEQLILELQQARREYAGLGVLVRGDADGKFQNVANALAAITKAGIAETSICVRLGSEENLRR